MFTFQVQEASLDKLVLRYYNTIDKNMEEARSEIRVAWGKELYKQQLTYHRSSFWPPLSKAYATRKARQYSQSGNDVRYNTTLRRTGTMLKGYVDGIQVNEKFADGSLGVTMPFPQGQAGIRAKAHQGVIGRPQGMPVRPFTYEGFHQIAFDKYKQAVKKSFDG